MLLFLISAAAAANVAACPVERAIYVQRDAPQVTIRFLPIASSADWPSRLALELRPGGRKPASWWLPYDGGSSGRPQLASTGDVRQAGWRAPSPDDGRARPLGDMAYIGMDGSYRIIDHAPRRGDTAPAHLLLPELREILHYRAPAGQRAADSGQMFDLTGCAPA